MIIVRFALHLTPIPHCNGNTAGQSLCQSVAQCGFDLVAYFGRHFLERRAKKRALRKQHPAAMGAYRDRLLGYWATEGFPDAAQTRPNVDFSGKAKFVDCGIVAVAEDSRRYSLLALLDLDTDAGRQRSRADTQHLPLSSSSWTFRWRSIPSLAIARASPALIASGMA